MRTIIDRALLLLAAILLLAIILVFFGTTNALKIGADWPLFAIATLVTFGGAIIVVRLNVGGRHKRLYRTWPLVSTFLIVLAVHSTLLGLIIHRYHPEWKTWVWLVISVAEVQLLAIATSIARYYCAVEKPMPLTTLWRHLNRHAGE